MFVVVVGGGKVGVSVTRTLLALGHELVLVEQEQPRYERLEEEFQHRAIHGDATEIFILERAGLGRPPDILVVVTGDDEDNIIICQLAREKYGVPKVIARVNDPRNEPHFDLLGISPTVSATSCCDSPALRRAPLNSRPTWPPRSIPASTRRCRTPFPKHAVRRLAGAYREDDP